jgi:hypothetical protein
MLGGVLNGFSEELDTRWVIDICSPKFPALESREEVPMSAHKDWTTGMKQVGNFFRAEVDDRFGPEQSLELE